MTKELKIETKRGTLLDGVLFGTGGMADTVLICITGIHGNFYSNPFYYNIGNTLTTGCIDFIYAQTNDVFGLAINVSLISERTHHQIANKNGKESYQGFVRQWRTT